MIAEKIGKYSVPLVMVLVAIILLRKDGELFGSFLDGAREGMKTCIEILPTLIILLTCVKMFSASGALEWMCNALEFVTDKVGIPKETLPVIVMRPISGSAATATVNELFETSGPDSFAGRCASIIMGSSDTILYTLAMYFGAVGVTKTRHAMPAAFLTLVFCVVFSVLLTRVFF